MDYNIKEIAEMVGLEFHHNASDNSSYYVCPFCGGKGKLNLNFDKNLWRCNKCDESGNVIQLVSKIFNISYASAEDYLLGSSFKKFDTYSRIKTNTQRRIESDFIADEKTLDNTYRTMLSIMGLKEEDFENLKKRGLSKEAINKLNFASFSDDDKTQLPQKLLNLGCSLEGVPGFYKENGEWVLNTYNGFLVPFVNFNGMITGMQIRITEPGERAKYVSLSSTGKECGTKSRIPVHLIGFNGQKSVLITEGALKADVASFLFYKIYKKRVAIMAIPGVNNTKYIPEILEYLKSKGVTNICEAFDMDKMGNESVEKNVHVEKAMKKIRKIIAEHDLSCTTITWKREKGIDDFLKTKTT